MSLILDALNRSERERRLDGDVPGIATEHYVSPVPGSPRRLPLVLGLALLVAGLLIGWLLLDRFQAPAPVAEPPRAELPAQEASPAAEQVPAPAAAKPETASGEASEARPRPVPVATPAEQPVLDASPLAPDAVASLYASTEAGPEPVNPPSPEAQAVTKPQAERVPVEAAAPAAVAEEPVDIQALVARAEDEVNNARLAEHPAPFLAALSQQKKDQIPSLMYSRHDYAGERGQSSVVINGKQLRAGGSLGGGVSVKEILPDSVVLSHQGTEFRLRALNSWVNL